MITSNEIKETIKTWTEFANQGDNKHFDIAIMKIWIKFEQFLSDLFVNYVIGQPSEKGYIPELYIKFKDEEQFNAFMRDSNKKYIDYFPKIINLSKHIFKDNPFSLIFEEAENKTAIDQIKSIRNYVAHESGEAKGKMFSLCNISEEKFSDINEFLKSLKKGSNKSNYSYYTEIINNIVELIIDKRN